jgi:iron complex transport system ATP-binding protein
MTIECIDLTVSVNGRILVEGLDLKVSAGVFVCMLGPNGVGKTLTLHTLAGLRESSRGSIRLNGKSLTDLDRRNIARSLGLLTQNQDDAFPTSVTEAVLMGRHPWLSFLSWESRRDMELTQRALDAMDLSDFGDRLTATLSGGERRRVALATLLVQDPAVMLLDEPLNHLDPLHKLQVLSTLSALAGDGKSIVASLHDPAMAARYSDAVLLLYGDGHWEYGPTAETLTAAKLERLFGTPFREFTHEDLSVLLPLPPRAQDDRQT